jgi:hypothetical protein
VREVGGAPYINYRPAKTDETALIHPLLEQDWLKVENLKRPAAAYTGEYLVLRHLEHMRQRRIDLIDKAEAAISVPGLNAIDRVI